MNLPGTHYRHTSQREREIVADILASNGTESIREAAQRLDLPLSTLYGIMRRNGWQASSVAYWTHRPNVSVGSREMPDHPTP